MSAEVNTAIELPKTSQLSPWWRDQLTEEQVAYAALDAVMALKLAAALQPRIEKLSAGPDGRKLFDRLCRAVMPVARMELAGIMLDRTVFYATGGGQPGDNGVLRLPNGP